MVRRKALTCLGAAVAAVLSFGASALSDGEPPFSFRPDQPEPPPASADPAARQRSYGYESALQSEIRRLEQQREPLSPGQASRLNRARSELQRLRDAER